jgi:hypothetical protein
LTCGIRPSRVMNVTKKQTPKAQVAVFEFKGIALDVKKKGWDALWMVPGRAMHVSTGIKAGIGSDFEASREIARAKALAGPVPVWGSYNHAG